MSTILMNITVKLIFGKLSPLPWHIEPVVKELIIGSFIIGVFSCLISVMIIGILIY